MACLVLSPHNVFTTVTPSKIRKLRFSHQVRAHSYKDHEERSSKNTVDANLCVLKARIGQIRMRERLEQRHVAESAGWDYVREYDYDHKRDEQVIHFLQILGTVCGTLGLTISTCTLLLFLVSLIIQRQ